MLGPSAVRVGIACARSSQQGSSKAVPGLWTRAARAQVQRVPSRAVATSVAVPAATASKQSANISRWAAVAALAFGGVAVADKSKTAIQCEPAAAAPGPRPYAQSGSPVSEDPPQSIVNVYQLSFGAICGICAGVFIKKGLKFIAFLFGGGFILLQYLSQQRLISVNWGKFSQRYNNALESSAGPVDPKATGWNGSVASRLYHRFIDFLTANFQERATLLAGLALGLRLG